MRRIPIIGTRGSALALWQARRVAYLLGTAAQIKTIKTAGDKIKGELPASKEVGFFTREIQAKLLNEEVDIAVHSLKDLPTTTPPGLVIAAVLERDFVTDVIITFKEHVRRGVGRNGVTLANGLRIGTSSLRRRALCAHFLPGSRPVPMRGNVDTRIRKLREGKCDALILSRAGVERLLVHPEGLVALETDPRRWIPSPGQGVIAVEVRAKDAEMLEACSRLDHPPTRIAVQIERELVKLAGGGCHAPFAAYAAVADQNTESKGSDPRWYAWAGMTNSSGQWRSAMLGGDPKDIPLRLIAKLKKECLQGKPNNGEKSQRKEETLPLRPLWGMEE